MHAAITALVERMMRSEELLIIGLGDSLTYGWEVERGFFDRFIDILGGRFPSARIERHNAGIPGDTADGGLARLGRLLDFNPDLVIVQFALNDAFSGIDPRDFEGSMQSIAARVLELPAAVMLVTSCALEREHDAAIVRPFYDAIIRVGSRLSVPVAQLDRFWSTSALSRSGAVLHNADGVHPNDQGYALMAEGLLELFENDA
jgi:acyl-CoA thioesterase-1